ncbi:hypothetical protein ACA910_010882 [Epithemia clementina (nom. ined.)]
MTSRILLLFWLLLLYCVTSFGSPVNFENERRLEHDVDTNGVTDLLDIEFQQASEDETRAFVAEVLRVTGCSKCQRLVPFCPKFETKLVRAGWDRWYRCDCEHAAGRRSVHKGAHRAALQHEQQEQQQRTTTEQLQPQVTGRGTLAAVQKLRNYVDQKGVGLVGLHTVSPEYKAQQAVWKKSEYEAVLQRTQGHDVVWTEDLPENTSQGTYLFPLRGSETRVLKGSKKINDKKAEPDRGGAAASASASGKLPNDVLLKEQTNFETINLYPAWEKMDSIGWGDKNDIAIVHIMDSGIDTNHEDLGGNLWINKDELCDNDKDDDENTYIDDCHGWNHATNDNNLMGNDGHGSYVSGIIAADTNNKKGISGICGGGTNGKGAALMIDVIFGADSNGNTVTGGFVQALLYATHSGADVSSNSWSYIYPGAASAAVLKAIDYAVENNVIVVFAAGNSASAADFYPSFHHSVITVSATMDNKQAASYTNFGRWIDIAAPGDGVLSTGKAKSEYVRVSGTSFSTPHASGVLAMGKMYKPSASPNELKSCLLSSAQEIGSIQANQAAHGGLNLGSGMIDAHAFLGCLDQKYICGNGIIEQGEVCDWFQLGQDMTCLDLGPEYIGGKIRCFGCQGLDYSGCIKDYQSATLNIDPDAEISVTVEISPPTTGLVVARLSGGSGSRGASLYFSKGEAPTRNKYQCRSNSENLNNEHCTLSGPGTYYVMVHNEDQASSIIGIRLAVFADGAQ